MQHTANANPDNHWDRRFYCWTSDPDCGLDVAPKRPHLDLKDPTLVVKHHRDAAKNGKLSRSGFGSF